jgi:hypothetical protein
MLGNLPGLGTPGGRPGRPPGLIPTAPKK